MKFGAFSDALRSLLQKFVTIGLIRRITVPGEFRWPCGLLRFHMCLLFTSCASYAFGQPSNGHLHNCGCAGIKADVFVKIVPKTEAHKQSASIFMTEHNLELEKYLSTEERR